MKDNKKVSTLNYLFIGFLSLYLLIGIISSIKFLVQAESSLLVITFYFIFASLIIFCIYKIFRQKVWAYFVTGGWLCLSLIMIIFVISFSSDIGELKFAYILQGAFVFFLLIFSYFLGIEIRKNVKKSLKKNFS